MNLIGTARATQDPTFREKVRAAMVLTAVDITNGDLPQGHPRDLAALEVLQNPEANSSFTRFLWLTAANAAIASTVDENGHVGATDNDIHYVVSGVWNHLYPDPDPLVIPN